MARVEQEQQDLLDAYKDFQEQIKKTQESSQLVLHRLGELIKKYES